MKTFNIVVALDDDWGIGKNGFIPWAHSQDLKHFRDLTSQGRSALIMGRITFDSMKDKNVAWGNRVPVVVGDGVTFEKALEIAHSYDNIWVCGGKRLYVEALTHPRLHKIYVTHISGRHDCDVLVPEFKSFTTKPSISSTVSFDVYCTNVSETNYLECMKNILSTPDKPSRSGGTTRSIFGVTLRYPLGDKETKIIPLFTTKKVPFGLVIGELLWFLSAGTNVKPLIAANNHIWDGNSTREYLDSRGLTSYEIGELGPIYGFQWRNWGAVYKSEEKGVDQIVKSEEKGIDQIAILIENIRKDPYSRRHVVSAWNVSDLDKMALPPCHYSFVVVCDTDGSLSMMVNMRSNDMFLGHPFNAASYACLAHMIASSTGRWASQLVFAIADAHIYCDHIEVVAEQIKRSPIRYPRLQITSGKNIDDYTLEDFKIIGYECAGKLTGKMVA